MSFDNASLEQLVDLSNLIYDENDTVEIFLTLNNYDEQATRESLIEVKNMPKTVWDHNTFKSSLVDSITCHHIEIYNYIKSRTPEMKPDNDYYRSEFHSDSRNDFTFAAFKNFNYSCFPDEIDDKMLFYYACKYDYASIVEKFMNDKKIDVIPNNELKQNKRKYPDYEFEKPDSALIAFHFLEHIFLILTGIMMILGIIPNLPGTLTYILLIIFISLILVMFYVLQVVFSIFDLNFINKEDFTLSQLSLLLRNEHPIDSYFVYVTGQIKRHKGGYNTCYSKGGISLQVESNLLLPYFDQNNYKPDFLYIIISQKVNVSDELLPWFDQAKEKVVSCENKHSATGNYHPLVEGKNFISNGKKIPSKYSKSSAFASAFLGVGVYYELLKKSIPIKRFTQNSNIYAMPDCNYNETILNTRCSSIGECKTANDIPH